MSLDEESPLLGSKKGNGSSPVEQRRRSPWLMGLIAALVLTVAALAGLLIYRRHHPFYSGPYELIEIQEGQGLVDHYTFRNGPDSIGSDGFNTYVNLKRAKELGIFDIKSDEKNGKEYVYMSSASPVNEDDNSTHKEENGGKRESIRLEGKTRFNKGLFILDVEHMPAGCGVWPAFWLADERVWPNHGEIDILESINDQTVAKTAMHTGKECSMYSYVSLYDKTGTWDKASEIPGSISGSVNNVSIVEADNCWVQAPHQWRNQGCVGVSSENGTIGAPMNRHKGGVYVLEWDPVRGYIKSWVFRRSKMPANLKAAIGSASQKAKFREAPVPDHWDRPYAYFAIGPNTGCSSDHFRSMRLIFDLAFCGQVSGAKFAQDCPALMKEFSSSKHNKTDPTQACNAYIATNPEALEKAYWKVGGVYVYQKKSFY